MLTVTKVTLEKGKNIIEGIKFSLTGGQILQVMGPNGVGKTSLLRSISEISPPMKVLSIQPLYLLCSYQRMVATGITFSLANTK